MSIFNQEARVGASTNSQRSDDARSLPDIVADVKAILEIDASTSMRLSIHQALGKAGVGDSSGTLKDKVYRLALALDIPTTSVGPGPSDYELEKFKKANDQASCPVKIVGSVAVRNDANSRSAFLQSKITKQGLLLTVHGDLNAEASASPRLHQTRPTSYKRPRSKPRPFVSRTCMLADARTASLAKDTPGPSSLYVGPRATKEKRMPCATIAVEDFSTAPIEYTGTDDRDGPSNERDGWATGRVNEHTGFIMTAESNNTIGPASFGIMERGAAEKKLLPVKHQQAFAKASRFISPEGGAVVSPGPIYRPAQPPSKDGVSWRKAIPPGTSKMADIREARRQEVSPGPGEFHTPLSLVKRSYNERVNSTSFSAPAPLLNGSTPRKGSRRHDADNGANDITVFFATRDTLTNFLEGTHSKTSEHYSEDTWTRRAAAIQLQSLTRGSLSRRAVFLLRAKQKRKVARAKAKREATLKKTARVEEKAATETNMHEASLKVQNHENEAAVASTPPSRSEEVGIAGQVEPPVAARASSPSALSEDGTES